MERVCRRNRKPVNRSMDRLADRLLYGPVGRRMLTTAVRLRA